MLTGHERIADLATQVDGLAITCRGCSKVTCVSFKLLAFRHKLRPDEILGFLALRLKCSSCKAPVTDLQAVRLWRVNDGQPKVGTSVP